MLKGISDNPVVVVGDRIPEGHRAPFPRQRHGHERHIRVAKAETHSHTHSQNRDISVDYYSDGIIIDDVGHGEGLTHTSHHRGHATVLSTSMEDQMDVDVDVELSQLGLGGFGDDSALSTPSDDDTCSSCDISRSESPISPMPMMRPTSASEPTGEYEI